MSNNISTSYRKLLVAIPLALGLVACGGGGDAAPAIPPVTESPVETKTIAFYKNQVGYVPAQKKLIIVRTDSPLAFTVSNMNNGETVLSGVTSQPAYWSLADETLSVADVSGITAEGQYRLNVADSDDYTAFKVSAERAEALHDASIKAYYFNRASAALDPAFAGKWQRAAGHPDTHIINLNNPDQPLSSPRGWYDAGDYNKYIVNSGISTYTLMRAYLDFADFYDGRTWNIPESTNAQPDLLDEVSWNLAWMLTMQDADGGVFHKLTTLNFAPDVMPAQATAQRYVVDKGTAATLNFAGVMATAARVYPDMTNTYLSAAEEAWQWATSHPDLPFANPENVVTGEYGDNEFNDEFAWAATELYLTTGNQAYLTAMDNYLGYPSTPGWSNTMGLAYLSLLSSEGQSTLGQPRYNELKARFLDYATQLAERAQVSPLKVAMNGNDFVWGSNGVAMNHAMMLAKAYELSNDSSYLEAMTGLVDYVLGKNPTGYSFVTGHGEQTPMFIHHRQSHADDIAEPVPGFLAGGPQNGHQDNCNYSSSLPATSYLDDWCSYSTNEVTINWNAPLVYSVAALLNYSE
ncbi:glycoside hydrolase family 9 protein [Alteromonas gilva]|uniref:Endoglucanase n=1 Tax=Alteromonas gilva TaxID=2987522 RepID=A0ABT5L7A2_9ALTE|nr:glycoside hydrolase family 9 protein [Alteromonas gilva]MDC8832299.1 glycoside hydrolase family 9 protein [Alteromonas gilva]